jgi:hypothetical protein
MSVVFNEQPAVLKVVNDSTAIVQINGGAFGPAGQTGDTGPQGVPGGSIISGSGLPSNEIGNDGDVYIDTLTGYFYGPKLEIWPQQPFFFNYNQRFEYNQALPSDSWIINHNLSGKPSVSVVDSAGTIIIGDIQYISNTQVQVTFTAPFSGSAYLT